MHSLQKLALGAAVLGGSAVAGKAKQCTVSQNSPLSCHNQTAVQDTCCFNAPGGQLLQTQFWDVGQGPSDSWTIHGLWPDNCDGTYQANCDKNREYTNITDIIGQANPDLLSYMKDMWLDENGANEEFWEHEWGKHGTCISTLEPSCYQDYQPSQEAVDYFGKVVDLFKTLDSYKFLTKAGIQPSSSKTYTSKQVLAALKAGHGATPAIQCEGNNLDEVWYFFNVQGSIQSGKFVASEPDGAKSDCPDSGIKWLPKTGGGSGGGNTTTTTSSPKPSHSPTPAPSKHGIRFGQGPVQPRWI